MRKHGVLTTGLPENSQGNEFSFLAPKYILNIFGPWTLKRHRDVAQVCSSWQLHFQGGEPLQMLGSGMYFRRSKVLECLPISLTGPLLSDGSPKMPLIMLIFSFKKGCCLNIEWYPGEDCGREKKILVEN